MCENEVRRELTGTSLLLQLVGPGGQTQVIKLGNKHLIYTLSHISSPSSIVLIKFISTRQ